MSQAFDHRPTDNAKFSAAPTSPGPELDRFHSSHHDTEKSASGLPTPPLFSPPACHQSSLEDHPHDISPDISFSHSSNLTTDLDLTLKSSQNNSTRGSIEPRTPEPFAPNLSFINFVTGQTPSLSLKQLDEPEEKAKQVEEKEETLDRSETLEDQHSISHHHGDQLVGQASVDSPKYQERTSGPSNDHQAEEKTPSVDLVELETLTSDHAVSENLPPEQNLKPLPKDFSVTSDSWSHISNPEFRFAIGLFAAPWSTLIISTRMINQLSILAFSQPILNPISGVLTSIFAPALLYGFLITLVVTSFESLRY